MSVIIPRVGNYLSYKYPEKNLKSQSQKLTKPGGEYIGRRAIFVDIYYMILIIMILCVQIILFKFNLDYIS